MGALVWVLIIFAWIIVISRLKRDKQKKQAQMQQQAARRQAAAGNYQQQMARRPAQGNYQQQMVQRPAPGNYQQQMAQRPSAPGNYRPQMPQGQPRPQGPAGQRVVTEADRARLEKYRQQKAAKQSAKPLDIVERAKNNASQYSQDTTLTQMEAQHRHSERVAPTTDTRNGIMPPPAHPKNAGHVSEFISRQDEELLGSVEDLMVKGYSGKLSFERDFLGEAMDMIESFTVPDTLPGSGVL